jgi:hypothetical protein
MPADNLKKPNVNTPSEDWQKLEVLREPSRWLMGGTETVIYDPAVYKRVIPQLTMEHDDDYKFRREHLTVIEPFFADAVNDIVAGILGEQIRFNNAPELMVEFFADVDRMRDVHSFMSSEVEGQVAEGLNYIHVSHTPPAGESREDEEAEGARPFWAIASAANVIDADVDEDGLLQSLRIREFYKTGPEYGKKKKMRVREYKRGNARAATRSQRYATWQLFVENMDEASKTARPWVPDASSPMAVHLIPPNGMPEELDPLFIEIPVYEFYGRYRRAHYAEPVFKHLARQCLLFTVKDSDYNNILHHGNVPERVINGMSKEQFLAFNEGKDVISASNTKFLSGEAKMDSFEHAGSSVSGLRVSLIDLEERIRRAASDSMNRRSTQQERGWVRLADEKRRMTRFQLVALSAKDAFYRATKISMAWLGRADNDLWAEALKAPDQLEWILWPKADPSVLLKDNTQTVLEMLDKDAISIESAQDEIKAAGSLSSTFSPSTDATRRQSEADESARRAREAFSPLDRTPEPPPSDQTD